MREIVPAGLPHHIGILNDYVRIPYANGSSFASQRLYREFCRRGHDVTVMGPNDPSAQTNDTPRRHLMLSAWPLRNHPGVYLPIPTRKGLRAGAQARCDILLGQTGSAFTEFGVWLRYATRTPFLAVNTVHFPSVYNVVLPDRLNDNVRVRRFLDSWVVPKFERGNAKGYNRTDGLIVLSKGLERYWRNRGVTVPIYVIPRSIDVDMFTERPAEDPFAPGALKGGRLLVLCRHTREKAIPRLLNIFARHIAPKSPDATLTLVGDGPDHDAFRELARELGISHRTFFPGECSAETAPVWYRHADLFLYTSLSETYGQVVSEAAWCGLPAVAFADEMGVSHQIEDGNTGILVQPTPGDLADCNFGAAVLSLLNDPERLRGLGQAAQKSARARCTPAAAVDRHYEAFAAATEHCRKTLTRHTFLPRTATLCRWTAAHVLAYLAGRLREPAVLNRHGRRAPLWDEVDQTSLDFGLSAGEL